MIVSNPLPIRPPTDLGDDPRAADARSIGRLWKAVSTLIGVVGAFWSGRLLEWHEEETVDNVGVTILHNLGRVPFGVILLRTDVNRNLLTDKEQWTDTSVKLRFGGATSASGLVTFILL